MTDLPIKFRACTDGEHQQCVGFLGSFLQTTDQTINYICTCACHRPHLS